MTFFYFAIHNNKSTILYKYIIHIFHLSPQAIRHPIHRTFKPLIVFFRSITQSFIFHHLSHQKNSYFFPELLIDKFRFSKYKLPFH